MLLCGGRPSSGKPFVRMPARSAVSASCGHDRFENRSVEGDFGGGNDVPVVVDLLADEGREIARRGGLHLEAELRQAISHGWRLQSLPDRSVELVDDRLRCFGGSCNADPSARDKTRQASLI